MLQGVQGWLEGGNWPVKEARGPASCQVGESAILGAAGRHLACTVKGWRYLEGSYDRLLLKRNLARPAMNFGLGGGAGPLDVSGLGVRRIRWRPAHIEDWGERTWR